MYSYMIGKITEVKPTAITLEVNNIGYNIIVANPYRYKLDLLEKVYLFQNVKEDALDLFGFKSSDEKELFVKLISVKGIGPKSALSILASGSVNDVLMAIEDGNVSYLMKFPGIGQKASQQIILDLKGKLSFENISFVNENLISAEEALQALGYKKPEIKKVMAKLDISLSTEDLIKQALKLMLK